jgi:hypothetical protein
MKIIGQCITNPTNHLQLLLSHSRLLNELQKDLLTILPNPLPQYCYLANIRDNVLIIHVDSSHIATRLRYIVPELIEKWHQNKPNALAIEKIKIKVQPFSVPITLATPTIRQISTKTAKILCDGADACDHKPLQAILLRLADYATGATCE